MERKKGIFLLGIVIGMLMMLLGLSLHQAFASPSKPFDLQQLIDYSISQASPSVVGVVNVQKGLRKSTGSGVIYKVTDEKTYVVTNYHVVQGSDQIDIVFKDDRREEGTLIGYDFMTDLAIVTIKRHEFDQPIVFSEDIVSTGDFVLAIGNPLGLDLYGTITLGIISASERFIPIDYDKDGQHDFIAKVIQTDAAINPGNSGGALVNLHGHLIGINSMKIAGSQVEGIGFSIPTGVVNHVIQQLESHGKVMRPFLGVQVKTVKLLTKDEKSNYGIEQEQGVVIVDVKVGSPAEQGGLVVGDIITHIDGEAIEHVPDFRSKIYEKQINDTVTIAIIRNDERYEFDVRLSHRP